MADEDGRTFPFIHLATAGAGASASACMLTLRPLQIYVLLIIIIIRPPDILVGGLRQVLPRFFFFYSLLLLLSSATLPARWTELNWNRPHARKWMRFKMHVRNMRSSRLRWTVWTLSTSILNNITITPRNVVTRSLWTRRRDNENCIIGLNIKNQRTGMISSNHRQSCGQYNILYSDVVSATHLRKPESSYWNHFSVATNELDTVFWTCVQ